MVITRLETMRQVYNRPTVAQAVVELLADVEETDQCNIDIEVLAVSAKQAVTRRREDKNST